MSVLVGEETVGVGIVLLLWGTRREGGVNMDTIERQYHVPTVG